MMYIGIAICVVFLAALWFDRLHHRDKLAYAQALPVADLKRQIEALTRETHVQNGKIAELSRRLAVEQRMYDSEKRFCMRLEQSNLEYHEKLAAAEAKLAEYERSPEIRLYIDPTPL